MQHSEVGHQTERTTVFSAVRDFFYKQEVPVGQALVRICLPLVLFYPMLQRWKYVRELYSTDGATAQLSIGYGFGHVFPEFSGAVAVALYTLMMVLLVTSIIGWCSRISLIGATILYTYFTFIDSISTVTKYTVIATDAMIVLSVSSCGMIWSVDAWLKRRAAGQSPPRQWSDYPQAAVWPCRLLQILIGVVYLGAAFTKMHTPEFFTGDQLRYWTISTVNFNHYLGRFLAVHPWTLVISAYVTVLWEILFVFLVWRGWWRYVMLSTGVFFHLMTTLTLGLYVFPLVCFSVYMAFVTERDARWITGVFLRWRHRSRSGEAMVHLLSRIRAIMPQPAFRNFPLPHGAVFGLMLTGTVCLGVHAEHQLDRYGVRRPEGPHKLQPMDHAEVIRMIQSREPIREQDKFYSFNIGTATVGGVLANQRNEFRHGERILAQCLMNPPHEDMYVECNLHDGEDRVIERNGSAVLHESMRAEFHYELDEALPPGKYALVIRSSGEEIGRRTFTLKANDQSGQSPPRQLAN